MSIESKEPKEPKEPDELDLLMQKWWPFFSFSGSLGNNLNDFTLSIENLDRKDLGKISDILKCIADLFSDITDADSTKKWKKLEGYIKELSRSENRDDIHKIFDCLSKIPPGYNNFEMSILRRIH